MSTMDSEQFFLKWNNFESNLASGFADLLQKEAMVDVTIAAEGKIIQAHKIILSICSSYFRNMFQVNPCQHPIVVLKDVRYQELTDMLDFMYKGEANVRQEDLPSFLKLAETLKVKGLAVTQGELDESSIEKKSESQISNLTKNTSSFAKEDSTTDYEDKEVVTRKKAKRCSSPVAYPEPRGLPHSPNIKMEMEECDNNFMRTSVNNGRNPVVKEERLSDNSMDSYGENHVANESWKVDKMAGRSTVDENSDSVQQGTVQQTRDYSFLESRYGNTLLILDGYEYRRKSSKLGKTYWFCCNVKCNAKGNLAEDGSFRHTIWEHNHEPDLQKIKRKQTLVGLKRLALQVNVSGQELLQALDIKEDVEKNLNFIRACRMRKRKQSRNTPVFAGLNYKHLPTRYSERGFLCHSGYLYRKHAVNLDKGCEYWKCRRNNCNARAKVDSDGNLTISQPLHRHSPEETKSVQYNREGQGVVGEAGKETELGATRKSVRLSQKLGKIKSTSLVEAANSSFCSDLENLEKLMEETLDDDYCVPTEFNG